ncbi:MAG: hypothetical protein M3019_03005 [Candidatus Dormibacteraeota bacterium]|nr:hypothetical protein [Candidatus Dormibacteraeota bacterium]
MLKPRAFWEQLVADPPRALMLIVMDSWKRIGDAIGMRELLLACGTFDTLCRIATEDAATRTQLSMSVYAATWKEETQKSRAVHFIERWQPLVLSAGSDVIPVGLWWTTLEVDAQVGPRELFGVVLTTVEGHIRTLPLAERFTPIGVSWEAMMGS